MHTQSNDELLKEELRKAAEHFCGKGQLCSVKPYYVGEDFNASNVGFEADISFSTSRYKGRHGKLLASVRSAFLVFIVPSKVDAHLAEGLANATRDTSVIRRVTVTRRDNVAQELHDMTESKVDASVSANLPMLVGASAKGEADAQHLHVDRLEEQRAQTSVEDQNLPRLIPQSNGTDSFVLEFRSLPETADLTDMNHLMIRLPILRVSEPSSFDPGSVNANLELNFFGTSDDEAIGNGLRLRGSGIFERVFDNPTKRAVGELLFQELIRLLDQQLPVLP